VGIGERTAFELRWQKLPAILARMIYSAKDYLFYEPER
jgi:hypothetical protein